MQTVFTNLNGLSMHGGAFYKHKENYKVVEEPVDYQSNLISAAEVEAVELEEIKQTAKDFR